MVKPSAIIPYIPYAACILARPASTLINLTWKTVNLRLQARKEPNNTRLKTDATQHYKVLSSFFTRTVVRVGLIYGGVLFFNRYGSSLQSRMPSFFASHSVLLIHALNATFLSFPATALFLGTKYLFKGTTVSIQALSGRNFQALAKNLVIAGLGWVALENHNRFIPEMNLVERGISMFTFTYKNFRYN
jgi:hypothetical protein